MRWERLNKAGKRIVWVHAYRRTRPMKIRHK